MPSIHTRGNNHIALKKTLYYSVMVKLGVFFFGLVVGPPLWKIWKSIGMIIPFIYGNIKLMATKPPTSDVLLTHNIPKNAPGTTRQRCSCNLDESFLNHEAPDRGNGCSGY